MSIFAKLSILSIALLAGLGSIQAAEMDIALKDKLASTAPVEFIRVLIVPVSDFDSKTMAQSISAQYTRRADRYRAAVSQLKQIDDVLVKNNGSITMEMIGSASAPQEESYNQKLSERRNDSVKKWFLNVTLSKLDSTILTFTNTKF